MRNLYDILGVTIRADQKEIKKAYRTLSKRYHPDSNQGDRRAAEYFHEITEAYGILSDEKKRADYDARLKEADVRPEGKKAAKKPSGNNGYQKNGYQKNEKMKANPLDVSDLFERYMGIRK